MRFDAFRLICWRGGRGETIALSLYQHIYFNIRLLRCLPKPATARPTMNCEKLCDDVWMISPIIQKVRPRMSVRRRPSKSPMKMVATADTIQPRCHVPTVRPEDINPHY